MSSPNLITRTQLAAMANVSGAHVTQQLRPGGAFCEARVGQRVDVDHPSIANWLRSKGVDPTTGLPASPSQGIPRKAKPTAVVGKSHNVKPSREGIEDSGSSAEVSKWPSLTLLDIARRFGGEPQFTNWLKALALVEEIRRKRLDNEETEHSLISRDLVERAMLGILEEQNQKLLNELPRTLARTIQTLTKSGAGLEVSEKECRKLVGQVLEATRSKITKSLKKAKK